MDVSKYFNVVNPPNLMQDLGEDPFINHALTNVCCELYYRYGMYLAPFTVMLTTARHIDFQKKKDENSDIKNETKEEIKESGERSERSPFKKPQQKNPKRVAAGMKGVVARKLKAEIKRKEAEKLKKRKHRIKTSW